MDDNDFAVGIITTRKCPTCGHHEVGFTDRDGIFYPLKEGNIVKVINGSSLAGSSGSGQISEGSVDDQNELLNKEVWAPAPLRGDRLLRCKYGVFYDKNLERGEMSPSLYEAAYKQKLQHLIEKEQFTPLPVILDRFFVAPDLAAGNPKQVAQTLWDELEEIRKPVEHVSKWIENRDMDSLEKMIHPRAVEDINDQDTSDKEMKKELSGLSLEVFFELLQDR